MGDKRNVLSVCAILLAGVLLAAPAQASAWEGGNRGRQEVRQVHNNRKKVYNHHRREQYVRQHYRTHDGVAVILPSCFFRIVIGNARPAHQIHPRPFCGK